jgi:hypothetical protein
MPAYGWFVCGFLVCPWVLAGLFLAWTVYEDWR